MTVRAVTQPAVRVQGFEKSYRDLPVLCGVDLEVQSGSILALLGSNGAGKTTLVRILSTLFKADAGPPTSTASTSPSMIPMERVLRGRCSKDAGLVSKTKVAQRRPVHLEAEVLDLMTAWIERYRRRAEQRYQRLDAVLARMTEEQEGQAS